MRGADGQRFDLAPPQHWPHPRPADRVARDGTTRARFTVGRLDRRLTSSAFPAHPLSPS